jgi:L-fuculose-phosphate aldolase
MKGDYILKREICKIAEIIYNRGLVVATDGNVSARTVDGGMLITPSGKREIGVEDIVKVSFEGNVLSKHQKPSSEYRMHIEVYQKREDVHGIVHTHPPYATAFAVAGKSLEPIVAEAIFANGMIPVTPYATPSTEEVPKSISELIKTHNSLLLSHHGLLTVGKDLFEALNRAERVEFLAKVTFLARMLGGAVPLSPERIAKLIELQEK